MYFSVFMTVTLFPEFIKDHQTQYINNALCMLNRVYTKENKIFTNEYMKTLFPPRILKFIIKMPVRSFLNREINYYFPFFLT